MAGRDAHQKFCVSFVCTIGYFLTVLRYIIVPFLLLFLIFGEDSMDGRAPQRFPTEFDRLTARKFRQRESEWWGRVIIGQSVVIFMDVQSMTIKSAEPRIISNGMTPCGI
jgi:hypothetical protein